MDGWEDAVGNGNYMRGDFPALRRSTRLSAYRKLSLAILSIISLWATVCTTTELASYTNSCGTQSSRISRRLIDQTGRSVAKAIFGLRERRLVERWCRRSSFLLRFYRCSIHRYRGHIPRPQVHHPCVPFYYLSSAFYPSSCLHIFTNF